MIGRQVQSTKEGTQSRQTDSQPSQQHSSASTKTKSKFNFLGLFSRNKSQPVQTLDGTTPVKANNKPQSSIELNNLTLLQTIRQHVGGIWAVSWSLRNDLLATAGHDGKIYIWAVMGTRFADEITQSIDEYLGLNRQHQKEDSLRKTALEESLIAESQAQQTPSSHTTKLTASSTPSNDLQRKADNSGKREERDVPETPQDTSKTLSPEVPSPPASPSDNILTIGCTPIGRPILHPVPYRIYIGHKSDILSLTWSENYFLASASIDNYVMLWNVFNTSTHPLAAFEHADIVSECLFHPTIDRFMLTTCFDNIIRVWDVVTKRIVAWQKASGMITSATFSPDGKYFCIGFAAGQIALYETENLHHIVSIDCRNRTGKDKQGRRVTGVQFSYDSNYLLVTTNDSRLRLISCHDYTLKGKFKGFENSELLVRATFSPCSSRILIGSGDGSVHMFIRSPVLEASEKGSNHTNISESFKVSNTRITVADFVPLGAAIYSKANIDRLAHMIITCDLNGEIKFYENLLPEDPPSLQHDEKPRKGSK